LQPPLQRAKRQPFAGTAFSVSVRPAANVFEQRGVHATRPFPATEVETGTASGPKTAVAAAAASSVSRQPIPGARPFQPTKRVASLGSALR
jgi:hypothetical protein